MLLGGKVEFGETTTNVIRRGVSEELGINLDYSLTMIIENVFKHDGKVYHEINFDFEAIYDLSIEKGEFTGLEGKYMIFK